MRLPRSRHTARKNTRHTRQAMPAWKKWFSFTMPSSATGEVWDRWQRLTKSRYPILYFLRQRVPTMVRVKIRQTNDKIWWVRYRTINRNHVMRIRDLKPGYYEPETKILYASFSLLREYVEVGLACRNFRWYEDRIPKWVPKWLKSRWPRKIDPEAGIAYLRWEIEDEDVQVNSPAQSETAATIMRLYLWWTQEREERIDPHEDYRIWEGVERPEGLFTGGTPAYSEALDAMSKANDFYEAQDQAMLVKLISVRRFLWS